MPAASRADAHVLRRSELLPSLARRSGSADAAAKLFASAEDFADFAAIIEAQLRSPSLGAHPSL